MDEAREAPDQDGPYDNETVDSLLLIRLAQVGDKQALERLLRRYYPSLEKMTRPRLGPALRRFAETGDVLQEALTTVIRDFDRFDFRSRDAFLGLMRRRIEYTILNLARKSRRHREREEEMIERLGSSESGGRIREPKQSEPSPSAVAGRLEDVDIVRSAIAKLAERTQVVIRLHHEGVSWKTIAERLSFSSEDSARMHYARAMGGIRRGLHALGDAD